MAEQATLMGPENCNLPAILCVFAEVYKDENICETSTDEKILGIFKALPVQVLQGAVANLTLKQQKKIEKMRTC